MVNAAKLIYDALCEAYPNAMQSIKDLSFNAADARNFIDCADMAFNYDFVYNLSPSHSKKVKEKSPDALFFNGSALFFVEFKEGASDRGDVRAKAHEGINTLYQFCRAKNVIDLDDFLNVDFRYALVYRPNCEKGSFLGAMNAAAIKFDLKNLEGFLYKEVCAKNTAKGILDLLYDASGQKIRSLSLIAKNQTDIERVTC